MAISENAKQTIRTILYAWRFPRDLVYCYWKLNAWHASWRLYGTPLIQVHRKAKITIGKDWIACSDPKYNSLGVPQKVIIKAVRPGAVITIGDGVGMSGVTISCGHKIIIGNQVLLGSGVLITDNDSHAIHPDLRHSRYHIGEAPVVVEDQVFIGARSIILKGVTIGYGAVIGAGSIVTKNVPAFSIVAGNPARIVGNVLDEKYAGELVLK